MAERWAQGCSTILPLDVRLANAALSYLTYLVKTIVPLGLACPYPHPYVTGRTAHMLWPFFLEAAVAAVLFAHYLLLGAAGLRARRYPYILVGWLWYVVSLLPVIGVVQVGRQAMADRYMYVPSIGLFIIFAWGRGHDLFQEACSCAARCVGRQARPRLPGRLLPAHMAAGRLLA